MRRLVVAMAVFSIASVAISWAAANDKQIAREITNRLKTEQDAGNLWGFDINLQVDQGKVVLTGFVATQQQQRLAVEMARKTAGVQQVVNQLRIEVDETVTDRSIATSIADQLAEYKVDGQMKDFRISVDVTDGSVTLHGSVASDQQRRLAVATARNIKGVRRVEDQLEVAVSPVRGEATPARSDSQIAAQIAERLRQHQEQSELKGFAIDVSVHEGVVTFDGQVSSQRQIALTLQTAQGVEGVRQVVSELTVVPQASEPVTARITGTSPVADLPYERPAIPQIEPEPVQSAEVEPQRARIARPVEPPAITPVAARPGASVEVGTAKRTAAEPALATAHMPEQPEPAALKPVDKALYERDAEQLEHDQQIGARLMKQLEDAKREGQLRGFGIGVHVHDGVVRLNGRVSSVEQQQLALDRARRLRGVRKVVNELTIADPGSGHGGTAQLASHPANVPVAGFASHTVNSGPVLSGPGMPANAGGMPVLGGPVVGSSLANVPLDG